MTGARAPRDTDVAARSAPVSRPTARRTDNDGCRQNSVHLSEQGRLLALDFGEAHVGVAVSDPTRTVAQPLPTVAARPWTEFVRHVETLVDRYKPVALLFGLAVREDGDLGPEARRQQDVARRLEQHIGVPILMYDERYTTRMARRTLRQLGHRGTRARLREHSLAAAHLLTAFLERAAHQQAEAPSRT